MKTFIRNSWAYFVGVFLLILIWQIASILYNNDLVFPTIIEIIEGLKEILISKQSYVIFCMTFLRVFVSIFSSVFFAGFLSFVSRKNLKIKQAIMPFMTMLKSTPVASIILILLIVFGHENSSIIIAFIVMLPIMYEGFYNSSNMISKDIQDEIKMISKNDFLVYKDIYFPIIIPNVVTTILQSFSLGIKSLVMAEVLTQPKYSIGKELSVLKNNFEMNKIIAWTLILISITIAFEIIMNKIKTKSEKQK